jgi:hypothetical protein
MAERAVYKSTSAEFLDKQFSGTPEQLREVYDRSLGLLDDLGDASLAGALEQFEADGAAPANAASESATGWRADPEVDRVIRAGYREAMRLASERTVAVPLETLWVTGASETFELHVCEGFDSVTVVLLIPGDRGYGSKRAQNRSFIVRVGADGDPEEAVLPDRGGESSIVKVQTSGDPSVTNAS